MLPASIENFIPRVYFQARANPDLGCPTDLGVFQTINDPKPVIANEAKRNVAIAEFEIASLHSVSLAMTIGHFFTWSTLEACEW
ncbi:hypothetical protein [Nostoc sp. 106C]|uniref:hypothetical protein n=1 Tax=Nostoc sp. 106C TaxID=1932667 RepID=UPI000A35E039|nr:hypothetical protein [Nostoc sp. 106C]OUL26982.1 hypothetical protein BV375_20050 [Nostoc sp. 106C]